MKFKFKKIASVLTSTLMLSSTLALAAAANYPAPFVQNGNADVAIVVGSTAAATDYAAVFDINSDLSDELVKQTATGGSSSGSSVSVSGEAAPLFSGASKININDTLSQVKSSITKSEMPNLLAETTFSGNVDAKLTQTIVLGNANSNPQLSFAKQPTSSDDPQFAIATSSNTGLNTYNATIDFNKAVNFTHADSKNQELTMFGQKFTVASSTDATSLVLLKSATTLNFDSSGSTSQEVTIEGKKYTVEMVSASTSGATIKVTNEAGASDQKEVNEASSKKINGLTVAVNTADSNNIKYTASVVAGAEKVTLADGSSVTYGDSDTVIDGTNVVFVGSTDDLTKLVINVRAKDSDHDAILPGSNFVDPVFGTFKVDFPGLNIASDNSTAREDIKVRFSGDDKVLLDLTDKRGNAKTGFQWAMNKTATIELQADNDGRNITVNEMAPTYRGEYTVIGNEGEGRLLKVSQIVNQTTGYSNDKVTFQDYFSGENVETTLTGEGVGTVTVGGKVYNVNYWGASSASEDTRFVRVNSPDSAATEMVLYPTFESSKGAKVMFYEPLTINLDTGLNSGSSITAFRVPNGANAYQSVAITYPTGALTAGNFSVDGTLVGNGTSSKTVAITNTGLSLNFTTGGTGNTTTVYLLKNDAGVNAGNIVDPALVVLEEKDDNNVYNANVVVLERGGNSDDGIGVDEVYRTWANDNAPSSEAISLASDSKKTKEADLWGSIALIDSSDSDQKTATISYPDEQVYANVYVAANDAVLSATGGSSSGGSAKVLGSVRVSDDEVGTVSTKNLIVVGGSCVNKVAAELIGATFPTCGSDWETKTGAGAGSFLVQTFSRTGGKIATLVAGYNAGDTTNGAKYVTTQTAVDTTAGKKYKGTSATSASLVTTA